MTSKTTIDLASLSAKEACEKGYEHELRHPVTDDPIGVFVTVLGSESETFQAQVRRKANDRLKRQFESQRKGRDEVPTIEQAEKDAIELLVTCVTGWRTRLPNSGKLGEADTFVPTVTHGGKDLEFNPANVRFLLKERWIRAQIDEAVGDLGNFIES